MSNPKIKSKQLRPTPEGTPEEPKQEFTFSAEEREFLLARAALIDFAQTMIEDAQRVMQAYVSMNVCRNRLGIDPIVDRVTFNVQEGKLWSFEPALQPEEKASIFDPRNVAGPINLPNGK